MQTHPFAVSCAKHDVGPPGNMRVVRVIVNNMGFRQVDGGDGVSSCWYGSRGGGLLPLSSSCLLMRKTSFASKTMSAYHFNLRGLAARNWARTIARSSWRLVLNRTGWSKLYSGGARFEYRPEHWLSWPRFSGFPRFLKADATIASFQILSSPLSSIIRRY
jgi:hypothetical protein